MEKRAQGKVVTWGWKYVNKRHKKKIQLPEKAIRQMTKKIITIEMVYKTGIGQKPEL